MIIGPEEDAGRVDQARRRIDSEFKSRPRVIEGRKLAGVQGIGGFLGRGEVAHHILHLYPREAPGIVGQRRHLGRLQAEPRHAGIDVDQRRQPARPDPARRLPGRRSGIGRIGLDLAEIVERRDQAVFGQGGGGLGGGAAKGIDVGLGQDGADFHALVDEGDEEVPAAGAPKRLRDLGGAEPIGVGLDHGAASGCGQAGLEIAVIGGDGAEIDAQHSAGVAGRRIRRGGHPSLDYGRPERPEHGRPECDPGIWCTCPRRRASPCRSGHGAVWRC